MKFLVIGAGRMGYAITYDLIRSPRVEQVIVADKKLENLKGIEARLSDEKVVPVELDIAKPDEVAQLMSRCDVAISCVGPEHHYELLQCALKGRCHFVDLGGNETVVRQEIRLDELAKELELTVIPDLGLTPGLVSILALSAAESLDELYDIRMRCGAVVAEPPEGTLTCSQTFSVDGLITQYSEDAMIVRDGKQIRVPALTDVEKIEFPKPFGMMEAFNAWGGLSTLPKRYRDKIQHLDFKAIAYPGHSSQVSMLKELGLMSSESLQLPSGSKVVPREVLHHLMEKSLPKDESDVVLLRVTVTGVKERKPVQFVWECIDYGEQAAGLSALDRMTAFPASVIAQMVARGDISERGVLRQEESVPAKLFLAELESRGIKIRLTERAPVPHGA